MNRQIIQALEASRIEHAMQLTAQAVRENPASLAARSLYITLLCIQNDFLRADQQLHVLLNNDPSLGISIQPWRELLVAARQRHAVFFDSAAPELAHPMTPTIEHALQQLIQIREKCAGAEDNSKHVPQQATYIEAITPELITAELAKEQTTLPDTEWHWREIDWQDLDDRFSGIIELLGANGRYYWIDMHHIERLTIAEPSRLLDQLWLPVELSVHQGPTGRLYLPLVYPAIPGMSSSEYDAQYALGQRTDWLSLDKDGKTCNTEHAEERETWLTVGQGRRTWLIEENMCDPTELAGHCFSVSHRTSSTPKSTSYQTVQEEA